MHEIGHVLGMFHIQRRDDRDDVVAINTNFVMPMKKHNFKKTINGSATYYNIPYDISSLLHYKPLVSKF